MAITVNNGGSLTKSRVQTREQKLQSDIEYKNLSERCDKLTNMVKQQGAALMAWEEKYKDLENKFQTLSMYLPKDKVQDVNNSIGSPLSQIERLNEKTKQDEKTIQDLQEHIQHLYDLQQALVEQRDEYYTQAIDNENQVKALTEMLSGNNVNQQAFQLRAEKAEKELTELKALIENNKDDNQQNNFENNSTLSQAKVIDLQQERDKLALKVQQLTDILRNINTLSNIASEN